MQSGQEPSNLKDMKDDDLDDDLGERPRKRNKKNDFDIILSYGSATHDGNNKYQEDRIVTAVTNEDVCVCAVFDGHAGDDVADMCSKRVLSVIDLPNEERIPALDAIATSLKLKGGSTAFIFVLYMKTGLIEVTRVGDTEGLHLSYSPNSNTWHARKDLAECDHAPDSIDEFNRIKQDFPGREKCLVYAKPRGITQPKSPFVQNEDGKWISNPLGGHIKACVNGTWGSYMETHVGSRGTTRSVGNIAYKEYGMCSTPSTEILKLKSGNNEVFVIGSDGLFDGLLHKEIHAIVTRPELIGDGQTASEALLEAALKMYQMRFKSHIVDNISVIVIYVNVKNLV